MTTLDPKAFVPTAATKEKKPTLVIKEVRIDTFTPPKEKTPELKSGRNKVEIKQLEDSPKLFVLKHLGLDRKNEIAKEALAYIILNACGVPTPPEILLFSDSQANRQGIATTLYQDYAQLGHRSVPKNCLQFLPIFLCLNDTSVTGDRGDNILVKNLDFIKIDPECNNFMGHTNIFSVLNRMLFAKITGETTFMMFGSDPWAAFSGITFSELAQGIEIVAKMEKSIPQILQQQAELLQLDKKEIEALSKQWTKTRVCFDTMMPLIQLGIEFEKCEDPRQREIIKKNFVDKYAAVKIAINNLNLEEVYSNLPKDDWASWR